MNKNYQRLVVYLNNVECKKNFVTTFTYKDVRDEVDALNTVTAMHALPTDNAHDLSRKIKKAVFNGKELALFSKNSITRNGWVVK